jgi:hypothetical protein
VPEHNLGGCGGIQIKAEFVEDAVRDYAVGALTDPAIRDQLLAAAPKPDDTHQREVLRELGSLEPARQRLTDLAVDGTIPASEVRRKRAELDATETMLRRQLAAVATATTVIGLPLTPHELHDAWVERGLPYQRLLVGLLIDTITVQPAARLAPGRFDADRLHWRLHV